MKVIPGSLGKPAVVRMDGKVVDLDTIIEGQADLTIEPAEPGADAAPLLQEIVPLPTLTIKFFDRLLTIPPRYSAMVQLLHQPIRLLTGMSLRSHPEAASGT